MSRRVVDAHHHLWDLSVCHYPWLMAKGVRRFFGDPTPIQQDYGVDDLRADAAPYEIEASVHIQVGVSPEDVVHETRWVQSIADACGLPDAIVAYCDLDRADAPRVIEEHAAYPRFRGLRQIIGRSDAEDAVTGSGSLLNDVRWREHLAALGAMGLSFDLQLTPGQMAVAAEVLAETPNTPVALCHCGSPWNQTAAGLSAWREGLELLAALPNVSCKISGLGMFDHDWNTDSIRPIVETCIEVFGPARAMFGSNFPVDKLHASYAAIWGAYETIAAPLTQSDQDRLFGGTARAFYRIASDS
ncbi:MAG: amidohydrolase family protein [Pseudomonadota bacterium]